MFSKLILVLFVCTTLTGCSAPKISAGQHQAQPASLISHIVFVELNDPADYEAILADSDAMLATIPSVRQFAAGAHHDTGRTTISTDYDLAIYLGFDTNEGLSVYVAHPQHVAYVEKWKPRIRSLRVYDMLDATR